MGKEKTGQSSSPFGDELEALLRNRRELHESTLRRSRRYWTRMKDVLEKRSSERARAMLDEIREALRVLDVELKRRGKADG